MLAQNKIIKFR